MRRIKVLKRRIVSIMAVVLSMSFLFVGDVSAVETLPYAGSIDDISFYDRVFSITGETAHYKLSSATNDICPNNTSYFIYDLYRYNNDSKKFEEITGEDRINIINQAQELPYDRTLSSKLPGYGGFVDYLSRDLTVINDDTIYNLKINERYSDDEDSYYTRAGSVKSSSIFWLFGCKADGTGDYLIRFNPDDYYDEYGVWPDDNYLLKCSDFMSDEYVLYALCTGQYDAAYSTYIYHYLVPDGNIDAFIEWGDLESQAHYTLTSTTVDTGSLGTMYRMYNESSGEHFYTSNASEAQGLTDLGWNYEGHAWQAPTSSSTPVYRLYNPNSGEHHYTSSVGEKDNLVSLGWNDEGIGFYSDDSQGVPMYRLYNPNATGIQEAGAHHYTSNAGERDGLIAIGWRDEGIAWYGVR